MAIGQRPATVAPRLDDALADFEPLGNLLATEQLLRLLKNVKRRWRWRFRCWRHGGDIYRSSAAQYVSKLFPVNSIFADYNVVYGSRTLQRPLCPAPADCAAFQHQMAYGFGMATPAL